jgi:uncharacterized protein (DUF952 family)
MSDLVLLEIDPRRFDAPVVVEPAPDGSGEFPHLYSPLPVDAVVSASRYQPAEDGTFDPVEDGSED